MIYKNVELYNITEIIKHKNTDDMELSRIPDKLRLKLNPLAQLTSLCACGTEIRFNLVGQKAKILVKLLNPEEMPGGIGIVEVYHGSFQESAFRIITGEPTEIVVERPENLQKLKRVSKEHSLPFKPDLIRIILPYEAHICFLGVEGDEIRLPREEQVPKLKWLAYGSSITHGSCAVNPSGSYVMKTATKMGVDVLNLGFAGAAQLEPEMADYIVTQKWDFATLEMGINVIWDCNKNAHRTPEFFRERVDYFLSKIAKANPDKWIFCIDIFTSGGDYDEDNELLLSYRNIVREKVLSLNMPKIKYVYGRDMLKYGTGLSQDMIHPSMIGMDEIACNLSKLMVDTMNHIELYKEDN